MSVAALVVAVPAPLLKIARNSCPLSAKAVEEIVYLVAVAPAMEVQLAPASVETSHCTEGVGNPDAVASKLALWPSATVTLLGCLVTAGAFWTVSVAASLVALPSELVNTARYSWPLSVVVALAIVSVVEVAVLMLLQVLPPFVDCCHRTFGAGWPEAIASNVAVCPS